MKEARTTLLQDRLSGWFADHGIALSGPPRLTLIAGGRSNLTYRVTDDAGRRYVLRRPPEGEILPSAHDVGRENRIVSALAATPVPVPRSYGCCADPAVIGAPFYVMNLVEGRVLASDADGAAYPPQARRAASIDLIDVMARIHQVDVDAVGLGNLGRRERYADRQLRRWIQQVHAGTGRTPPLIDAVHARLSAQVPPQRFTGLVHGDYRPGNILVDPQGRVQAVLDWELAALGDTLADLGWLLATWRQPGEPELWEAPTAHPGYVSRAELLARYEASTGHDVSDVGWYQAFALWKLSCIVEGIIVRYSQGAMGDDGFDVKTQADQVVRLAEAANAILDDL